MMHDDDGDDDDDVEHEGEWTRVADVGPGHTAPYCKLRYIFFTLLSPRFTAVSILHYNRDQVRRDTTGTSLFWYPSPYSPGWRVIGARESSRMRSPRSPLHWHLCVPLFAGFLRSTYRLHESYLQAASKAILVDVIIASLRAEFGTP